MARAGLGTRWSCLIANDFDAKKGQIYERNWGKGAMVVRDVASLTTDELPGFADLAWASFPCQDLSLAGDGAGLAGKRSGTFWPFWRLVEDLGREGRAPTTIVLENVCGALTSHGGADFAAIGSALAKADYRFGALTIDAVDFVPQSRPRLFIIAARSDLRVPRELAETLVDWPVLVNSDSVQWRSRSLERAQRSLDADTRGNWLWWRLPSPPKRNTTLSDLVEEPPVGVSWHSGAETQRLLDMMSSTNASKVRAASLAGRRMVGTIYKRTRADGDGRKLQRAEIRFDNVAGCLRTPRGGSSRQTIMIVEGNQIRSRLISPREAARLMGLSDDYLLPDNYNQAYHLAGDGVVVPVVRHLSHYILEPLLAANKNPELRDAEPKVA